MVWVCVCVPVFLSPESSIHSWSSVYFFSNPVDIVNLAAQTVHKILHTPRARSKSPASRRPQAQHLWSGASREALGGEGTGKGAPGEDCGGHCMSGEEKYTDERSLKVNEVVCESFERCSIGGKQSKSSHADAA